jgi:hypothetical protein
LPDANVARLETRVERAQQLVARNRMIEADARDLCGSVHAGVGTAGGVERLARADNRRKFIFDDGLNGLRIRLPLPSSVGGTVVGDGELQGAAHCQSTIDRLRDCCVMDDRKSSDSIGQSTIVNRDNRISKSQNHPIAKQSLNRHSVI